MNRVRLLLLGALALAGGCQKQETGAVRVVVAGDAPAVVDPADGPIDGPQAVLLSAVAQGLVRFDGDGNIVGGLAERWNVSNDGLLYIFRLQSGTWPGGRKIVAEDVARLLRREIARASRNSLKDTAGAVTQIVAMTDRVLAIQLFAPRPHLLQLLAQPEFGIVRGDVGTGPFTLAQQGRWMQLSRTLPSGEDEEPQVERVMLTAAPMTAAVRAFTDRKVGLVLGGTFADLPLTNDARLPRGTLRFDPAAGLFGLVPGRANGLLADREVRDLLDRAIDRPALVSALGVPDLQPRASILEGGLDGNIAPANPAWAGQQLSDRLPALVAEAHRLFPRKPGDQPPVIRVAVPRSPGGAALLQRLRADWRRLGIMVAHADDEDEADLRLIDWVAPSVSPAWYLRSFRCGAVPICVPQAEEPLNIARETLNVAERNARLAEAERMMRDNVLFMPLAAPVRWSLVRDLPGFQENRFARHSLSDLRNGSSQ
ncbi:ABC transporter substrate-binding protein [Sphingomonas sp. KRR8]|uniref:ABC transporter substrate-binding protein n=1 Tax=Sphingomonas sp. KRR8 TaxID=2942996 RepID=UPI002022371B|nr:ABC transporter substrate-binding protein [Sphingomonas sp. KRR8]URD60660.1 ABC transporter substrate-binding protein [Sphingomonas sp. KRR8]